MNIYRCHDEILADLNSPDAIRGGVYLQDYYSFDSSEEYKMAVEELVSDGFIALFDVQNFEVPFSRITPKGRRIQMLGGYSAYRARLEAEAVEKAARELKAHEASILSAEAAYRSAIASESSAKSARRGYWISLAALFISVAVAVLQLLS